MTKRRQRSSALQDIENDRTSPGFHINGNNGKTDADPLPARVAKELDRLDRLTEPVVPNEAFFEQLVAQGKRELRRRLIRDLSLFWLLAVAFLLAFGAATIGRPMLFIGIQLAAVALAPVFVLVSMRRKRVNDRT
ncbi:MAG: hypothetical protein K0Q59_2621 [Paenibacillus sp.]|jgi:Flp pilus assembly protein TadB|nr:hypothetical protein [Paenibacillus sp.]